MRVPGHSAVRPYIWPHGAQPDGGTDYQAAEVSCAVQGVLCCHWTITTMPVASLTATLTVWLSHRLLLGTASLPCIPAASACTCLRVPCGQSYMLTCAILHALNIHNVSLAMHAADPRLTDYELLLENLRDLKDGKDIQASIAFISHALSVVWRRTHVMSSCCHSRLDDR